MENQITFLNGSPVPKERIEEVLINGPRSPAFYVHLQDWKEDKHIWEQIKGDHEETLSIFESLMN